MSGQRKPRNLADYTTGDRAANFLESVAKNVRDTTGGTLVKVDVQVRFYKPERESEPEPESARVGLGRRQG